MLQQQRGGHDTHAAAAFLGQQAVAVQGQIRLAADPEHAGDGGTGDIRVQDGGGEAPLLHRAGQQGGDQGFAHAALAADHADDPLDGGFFVAGYLKAFLLAILFAGAAVVIAVFTHDLTFPPKT